MSPNDPRDKACSDDWVKPIEANAALSSRYTMVRELGRGSSAKVVEVQDCVRDARYAVKIFRSSSVGIHEQRVLLKLGQVSSASNTQKFVRLYDSFDFGGHVCLVIDKLAGSLFDFLQKNKFMPFPRSHVQKFAQQLFEGVAGLHNLNIIHGDLKPENILLVDCTSHGHAMYHPAQSVSGAPFHIMGRRSVLTNTEIRLADFGMATFDNEYHDPNVGTPIFCPPEVILGLEWSLPHDIWSLGCIIVELFLGTPLFDPQDRIGHLAMMQHVIGHPIDPGILQRAERSENLPKELTQYIRNGKLHVPEAINRRLRSTKALTTLIPPVSEYNRQLISLLQRIFVFDPLGRITAAEALDHLWLHSHATNSMKAIGTVRPRIRRLPPPAAHSQDSLLQDINRIVEILFLILAANHSKSQVYYKHRNSFFEGFRGLLRTSLKSARARPPILTDSVRRQVDGILCRSDSAKSKIRDLQNVALVNGVLRALLKKPLGFTQNQLSVIWGYLNVSRMSGHATGTLLSR
ncbi:kinase-like domain-containing protein [Aspergillus arachidicola]|uniref:Kinase-like domain-containing protein n=1 Tax=Aspergillus arachidicola TaxID=656916 RepID=A0A5N6XS93_9EURO|nr:kinase-like domain-containing protein [Aspergillus arachidicola]